MLPGQQNAASLFQQFYRIFGLSGLDRNGGRVRGQPCHLAEEPFLVSARYPGPRDLIYEPDSGAEGCERVIDGISTCREPAAVTPCGNPEVDGRGAVIGDIPERCDSSGTRFCVAGQFEAKVVGSTLGEPRLRPRGIPGRQHLQRVAASFESLIQQGGVACVPGLMNETDGQVG